MAIRTTRECKAEAGTGREGTSQRPAQRGAGTERRRPGVHAHLDDDDPARARLAFRPDGLACALSARPGRACMALRLALEWLYLYDGGSWPCAAVPDFMCREVGWSGGYSVVLCGFPHSFAQSFVHPYASAYTKAPVKETGWSPKEKRGCVMRTSTAAPWALAAKPGPGMGLASRSRVPRRVRRGRPGTRREGGGPDRGGKGREGAAAPSPMKYRRPPKGQARAGRGRRSSGPAPPKARRAPDRREWGPEYWSEA